MKPPIRDIEISARQWDGRDSRWGYMVSFSRWSTIDPQTCEAQDFASRPFYRPTPASLARCRRAQEQMVAQCEEE